MELALTGIDLEMTDPLTLRVERALDTIRPYLIADGGNVRILAVSEGVAHLELLGACGTCPMSAMTLKAGVEEAIKSAVPEITSIVAVQAADQLHQL